MTPDEHAAKAIELLAHSENDIAYEVQANTIAQANVHALLATRTGPDLVDADLLHHAEMDLELAKARYRDLDNAMAAIRDHLNQYGQTFTSYDLGDIVDRVGELMDTSYNEHP